MESKSLVLSADSVTIQGKHFTVSNGFLTKADGTVQLKKKDLLSVDIVKRRSKKGMYAVLILGSILIFVLSVIRSNIESEIRDAINVGNIREAYETVIEIRDTVQDMRDNETAKAVVTGIIVFTAIICVVGAGYLFSGKKFVELVTMRGTYRVLMKRGDMETKDIVTQLRGQLQQSYT
jgi:hypothetical protein